MSRLPIQQLQQVLHLGHVHVMQICHWTTDCNAEQSNKLDISNCRQQLSSRWLGATSSSFLPCLIMPDELCVDMR